MTENEKQLLLIDLCARLPYNVVIRCTDNDTDYKCFLTTDILNELLHNTEYYDYKPYLRPMSSMTEEEESMYNLLQGISHSEQHWTADDGKVCRYADAMDFLLEHHFDFRGLIEKSLAIVAPEGMY